LVFSTSACRYSRTVYAGDTTDRQSNRRSFLPKTYVYILRGTQVQKEEEDLITHFDKWMFVLKNLHQLQDRPIKLQEKVFEKLFNLAEIAH
jgi:hypothetical protein